MTEIPSRARVVIIGGGVIGTSVAYHLAQLGWTDVLLLEQGQLSCGTTWHAAGLVGQLRASENGTRLVQYSCELYERLEAETGLGTGFRRCGGVTVARTRDRMIQLRRTAATAEAYQLECELISPARARELYPILRDDDLEGAIWLPGDGRANPTDLTAALARGARDKGVTIRERTRVTGIGTKDNTVTGVRTDQGDVEAEVVVNCAGQWAKAVGAMCGVTVPLHSAEHFYVVTEQIDGVHRDFPVLRDPDGYTYIKEEVGGLVVGGFEPDAKPWVSPDALPYPFEFKLLEEDWDHFAILMDSAVHRIPVLTETGIKMFYNGPESFTPDNQFILGEAPELRNFFVAAGFNSVGIASAGGAGRALAEWITEGEPGLDLSAVDIRRFAAFNGNNQWLHDRVSEVLGLHYALPWPNRELTSARPFRRSPAYHLLEQAGAGFGSKMGWERANFFAPPGRQPDIEYGWGQQNWQPWSSAEQRAARTGVALFDQTSFSKYLLTGPDAERALQWLCTADVAVPPGRTVYTGMLNAHGTYEADITVTRLSAEEFLLVSSAASTERDKDHITRRMPAGLHASLVDVTSQYAVYGVMGPRSRDLLSRLSRAGLSDEAFPFGTSRPIDLGYATVRATRITYVGELGWELYVPGRVRRRRLRGPDRRGRRAEPGQRRLLRDRVAAAREGVPGLRPRADPGLQPGRGRPAVRLQAEEGHRLPRPGGRRAGPGGRPAPPPGLTGAGRRPGRHDLGRRARPAGRHRRRPGDLGRLGRDPRRLRRPGLRPPPGRRRAHPRPGPGGGVPGERGRPALPGRGQPAPAVRPGRRQDQGPLFIPNGPGARPRAGHQLFSGRPVAVGGGQQPPPADAAPCCGRTTGAASQAWARRRLRFSARAATRNRRLGWKVPIAVSRPALRADRGRFREVTVRPIRISRLPLAVVAVVLVHRGPHRVLGPGAV